MEWLDLRCFLAVRRAGSLAGAARRLRIDATTVGRRLAALEERLDARLFHRTTDGWTLTEAGARLLPVAERIEESFADVDRAARGLDTRPAGLVRLTTVEALATHVFAPALPAFRARWPEIELELLCTARVLRLDRGEADVGVRLVRPREESLVGRRVGVVRQAAYAARAWLEAAGRAADLADLDGCDVLLYSDVPADLPEAEWLLDRGAAPRVALRTTSASTLLAAARAGLGVALLPRILADPDPALVRLDELGAPPERPVWLAVHRDLRDVARVRAVLDFVSERFAEG